MGIVTFAAPVSGLRGKVGGNVFSANKSGPYLKAWGRGSNPRSQIQTEHRASLVTFSQSWRDISGANKADWDTYAALSAQDRTNSLGETYSISGFAWFVAINLNRAAVGDSQLDTSPTVAVPAAVTIASVRLAVTGGSSSSRVVLTVGSAGLADNLAIYGRLVASDGVLSSPEIKVFIRAAVPNASQRVIITDQVIDAFGHIQANNKIFYRLATWNTDGRAGPSVTASAVATP